MINFAYAVRPRTFKLACNTIKQQLQAAGFKLSLVSGRELNQLTENYLREFGQDLSVLMRVIYWREIQEWLGGGGGFREMLIELKVNSDERYGGRQLLPLGC